MISTERKLNVVYLFTHYPISIALVKKPAEKNLNYVSEHIGFRFKCTPPLISH